jgi:prepilin-type N-terminal cleavage/methylation domain-containing protein
VSIRNRKSKIQNATAFTLIELLVVIAIIAILAAILFPVFGTIREQTRQGSTMSNMHAVYLGARLFYEDEGRYPSSLFGYAEVSLNNGGDPTKALARPALPSDIGTGTITAMDLATGSFYTDSTSTGRSLNKGYLYREQVKDFNTFVNGETPISHQQTGKIAATTVVTPLALRNLDNGTVLANQPVVWTAPSIVSSSSGGCSVYGDTDLPADPAYEGQSKVFYTMDSMDIGPRINVNDGSIATDGAGNTIYELHYSPDWTKERYDSKNGCDSVGNQPIPGQLKYKNPPTERTVLTYITDHVAFGHSPNVLILLMSGTARTMNYKQALDPNSGFALPFGYH